MTALPDTRNELLTQFQAYLETLTWIRVHPQFWRVFTMSDIIQETLVQAWQELEALQLKDDEGRKRWLRTVLEHKLVDRIRGEKAKLRDIRRTESLTGSGPADEYSSLAEGLVGEEQAELVLDALSRLDHREREAIILQRYHGWKLKEIAACLDCTIGVVAGLHARALKKLRKFLIERGVSHA
jgi:RNA polymerase sigma factor (sigma-70 family)